MTKIPEQTTEENLWEEEVMRHVYGLDQDMANAGLPLPPDLALNAKKAEILDELREWVRLQKMGWRAQRTMREPDSSGFHTNNGSVIALDDVERKLAHLLAQHDLLDECEGLPS